MQPSEAEVFWDEFLRSLADRGLRGVKLIIAPSRQILLHKIACRAVDDHKGLKAAAAKVMGASVQRCRVHFMRNALACVGKKDKPIVTAALRTAFDQDTLAASKEHWAKLSDAFEARHPKLADLMRRAEDDVLAYKTFPKEHWSKIHSINPLERLPLAVVPRKPLPGNGTRRSSGAPTSSVFGLPLGPMAGRASLPNEPAITRLVGASAMGLGPMAAFHGELLEQNDEWAVTRRYMTLETVAAVGEDAAMDPALIAAL